MTYFHSFWTRPLFESKEEQQARELCLWDFEGLAWLTSVLEISRHSPIQLITDSRGLTFVRNVGLDRFYNGGISTALDEIPDSIHPKIFWAAGKLYAYLAVQAPCVSLDTDTILWTGLDPAGPVMALHPESNQWIYYAHQRKNYSWCGFDGPEWDWEAEPFNLGLVYFQKAEAARRYAERAIQFMVDFSTIARQNNYWGKNATEDFSDAMLFAEQRIFPMCMKQLGLPVTPLGSLQPNAAHLARNATCSHLWTSKDWYRRCPEARVAFENYLIDYIQAHFPEVINTLAHWKLDKPKALDPPAPPDGEAKLGPDSLGDNYCLLGDIEGVVWLEDANVPVQRKAAKGSLLLPGERLRAEPGTRYQLIYCRREPEATVTTAPE